MKKEGGHGFHIEKPEIIELMGDGEDHMIVAARKEATLLTFQPLGDPCPLALRAEAMAAGVVPVTLIMAFGTGFHMAAKLGSSAYHQGAGSLADVIGERMGLFIRRIDGLHDLLDTGPPHSDIVSLIPFSVNMLPLFLI